MTLILCNCAPVCGKGKIALVSFGVEFLSILLDCYIHIIK